MKVLHILNELKHSGAEVMLQQAYERFASNGIQSHVLSTGQQVGDYASVLEQTGYRIHHIPFRKHPMFFVAVRELLRKERFPTVHLHTETGFIWYIFLLNMSGVTKVVKTYHNVFLFTGYLRWKRALQRRISRRVFCTIQHAISDSVQEFEKERFGNDCILIRNWTDTDRFRPPTEEERRNARSRYDLQPTDFTLLTVGSCTSVKNHSALFTAAKQAKSSVNTGKIVVLHVGAGPLLEQERSYAKTQGMETQCRFLGTLADIRPCLHAADAFVMPSLWEGLGNAALEAMSAGLPAILYNVYGLKDLVRDGKGGLLINPSEDALQQVLLQLVNNPALIRKKAAEAREAILMNYSLENSVNEIISLYTQRHHTVMPLKVTASN